LKEFKKIEFPRLPQVIAEASSIFSGLMILGILFSLLNNYLMRNKLMDDIGALYFDNYDSLHHKKNRNSR
jgi:hypothetical protein